MDSKPQVPTNLLLHKEPPNYTSVEQSLGETEYLPLDGQLATLAHIRCKDVTLTAIQK
jgi:hypothetical protein